MWTESFEYGRVPLLKCIKISIVNKISYLGFNANHVQFVFQQKKSEIQ